MTKNLRFLGVVAVGTAAAAFVFASSFPAAMAFAPPRPMGVSSSRISGLSASRATWSPTTIAASMMKDPTEESSSSQRKVATTTTKNPTPALLKMFQDGHSAAAVTASAAALAVMLMLMPLPTWAAMSGGRMGGGSFRSSPSMSVPRSSYGGGGYYSRPSVTVAPTYYYGSPFVTPFRPFYFGAPGVITYNRGPSLFDLVFFGGIIFAITSAFRGAQQKGGMSIMDDTWSGTSATSELGPGTSVLKISVAMDVSNRNDSSSILSVLHRLSQTAETDRRVGIQNLTSQVALELLRRKSSIVSATSSYQHYRDATKAQRAYQSMSVQERSKFEKELVSNYGGVEYGSSKKSSTTGEYDYNDKATMAVVTLVLAIDGDSTKIPTTIRSTNDVQEALQKIASDAKVGDCLQTAEILWTPEDPAETLTMREVLADYPDLRVL